MSHNGISKDKLSKFIVFCVYLFTFTHYSAKILIDIEEQKVVTEKFLPMKNHEVPESVFDLELIEDDEDNWGSEDK